ncbi:MAG: HAMP domain-containing histidine kinase [Rhodospirillaceae bacterium]|nr:HAMP domain-containing histidine kinase [Rhodospirillales bacterium]
MPALDTDTVILASSAFSVGFGCVLLAFSTTTNSLRLHWAAAVILYGIGGGLIGFRAVLPPWFANVFANMLVGGSVVLVHRGVWVMLGRKPPDRVYVMAVTALGVAYYILTYPMPDIGTRLFIVSSFRVPFFVSAALALYPLRRDCGGVKVLLWLLWLWSAWYMLRAGLALSSDALAVQVRTGSLQAINFLIAAMGNLFITAAQFRMEAERAVDFAANQAEELALQRHRLEEVVEARTAELSAAKDEAERANREKSHFLAAASHDLRQPLQALRLFLDILAVRLHGRPEQGVVDKAEVALASSEGLLHALLDISRLDAGVVPMTMEAIRLDAIIGKLVDEIGEAAAQKGIELRVVTSRQTIMTDRLLFERAIRNLLHNALRYTSTGRVMVGCRRRGDRLAVEVWDTGAGIPEDKLGLIFDDFYQLGNSERDQNKGLGLGLAILRRVAGLLDWRLDVRSRLGSGSVFSITVPLARS